MRIPNVSASLVAHILQTTSETSCDCKVVNLILIPATGRDPTDLVLEDCSFNDKMIGIAEIYKPLAIVITDANENTTYASHIDRF